MMSESLGFWGLAVAPGKTYTQTVEVPFCLTMAALGLDATDAERNAVVATVDGDDHVLCNLSLNRVDQQSLQHVFTEGTVVSFSTTGNSKIHLTGHYLPEADDEEGAFDYSDDDLDMSDDEEMEDYDMDDSDDEEMSDDNEVKVHHVKRLTNGNTNGVHHEDDEEDEEDDDYEDVEFDEEEDEEEEDQEDDDEEEEEEEESEEEKFTVEVTKRPASTTTSPQAVKKAKVEEIKVVTPKSNGTPPTNKTAPSPQATTSPSLKKKTLPSGLVIEDVKLGSGKRASKNSKCKVEYTGTLPNGKVFDKSKGRPFEFVLGKREVITGWDVGVEGMAIGGERKLIVPAALAYGNEGRPPTIPKNATLHFTIKLVAVE